MTFIADNYQPETSLKNQHLFFCKMVSYSIHTNIIKKSLIVLEQALIVSIYKILYFNRTLSYKSLDEIFIRRVFFFSLFFPCCIVWFPLGLFHWERQVIVLSFILQFLYAKETS